MSKLKILYRSIQEVPPEKWMEKLALEAETDAAEADRDVMDAECRRQDFFTWEREEVYIADSDSYIPQWMTD